MRSSFAEHLFESMTSLTRLKAREAVAQHRARARDRADSAAPETNRVWILQFNDVVLGVFGSETKAVSAAHDVMRGELFVGHQWKGGENNRWYCDVVARLEVFGWAVR